MQAALKTPHLLMQEKHELIQIIDGLLHVRLCGECSHALSQQIKPVRGKLLKYREELMRYEAKMKRRAAGTPAAATPATKPRRHSATPAILRRGTPATTGVATGTGAATGTRVGRARNPAAVPSGAPTPQVRSRSRSRPLRPAGEEAAASAGGDSDASAAGAGSSGEPSDVDGTPPSSPSGASHGSGGAGSTEDLEPVCSDATKGGMRRRKGKTVA